MNKSRLTDDQIRDLWLSRPNLHGGDLMLQLRDFARSIEDAPPPAVVPEPRDEALMKLSQFAHTAMHMSERDARNCLGDIADRLIALSSTQPSAAGAAEQEGTP